MMIMLEDGLIGIGYFYIGGKGGYVIKVMIDYDFVLELLGKEVL